VVGDGLSRSDLKLQLMVSHLRPGLSTTSTIEKVDEID
jgi:hypothetical protein